MATSNSSTWEIPMLIDRNKFCLTDIRAHINYAKRHYKSDFFKKWLNLPLILSLTESL